MRRFLHGLRAAIAFVGVPAIRVLRRLLRRLRMFRFTEQTRDRIAAWVVFVGVPAMFALVVVLMVVVGSWVSEAQQREQIRAERMRAAVEEVVEEIRQPGVGDTREETFDRIRQLCEAEPGCEP